MLSSLYVLTTIHGWSKDNKGEPLFYSGGDVDIYRVYNRELRGLHHWTTDLNEYNTLPKHGWKQEGVAFKATQKGLPLQTQFYKKAETPPTDTNTPKSSTPNGNDAGKELPNAGRYTFKKRTGIRNEAKVSAPIQFYYDMNQTVVYDQKLVVDGNVWLSYISNSGVRRYILVD